MILLLLEHTLECRVGARLGDGVDYGGSEYRAGGFDY